MRQADDRTFRQCRHYDCMMDRDEPLPEHVTASRGGVPYVPRGTGAAGAAAPLPVAGLEHTGEVENSLGAHAGEVVRSFCVKCGVHVEIVGYDSECPRCGFDTIQQYAAPAATEDDE